MTSPRITITTVATLACLAGLVQSASAASYQHVDELALQIQNQSRELVNEFRLHYRHTPEYGRLISDANQMYFKAASVHSIAHRHGNLSTLDRYVDQLDSRFHHLEDVLNRVECETTHGHGHIHGHTGHVRSLVHRIESAIHHLHDDIRVMRSHSCGHSAPMPVVPVHSRISVGIGHGSIGHGSIGRCGTGHGSIGHGGISVGVGHSRGYSSSYVRLGRMQFRLNH